MSKYALANIKYTHVTLLTGRYQQLVLRSVRQAGRALVVTRECCIRGGEREQNIV